MWEIPGEAGDIEASDSDKSVLPEEVVSPVAKDASPSPLPEVWSF